MKPSAWIAFAGLAAVVLGYLGTVEYRLGTYQATLDVSERVANLENLLTPLLIEYKVAERLAEMQPPEPPPRSLEGTGGTGFSSAFGSALPEVTFDDSKPEVDNVREQAEKWATEAIERPQRQYQMQQQD